MSHVTDTFLLTNSSVDPEYSTKHTELFKKIDEWIASDNHKVGLKRIDNDHKIYGGTKALQCGVWVGAFNYLSLKEFIEFLKGLDWTDEYDDDLGMVQLLYQDEHDTGFTLIDIHGEKEVHPL